MADVSPDKFAAPYLDDQASDRLTPESMGGGTRQQHSGLMAREFGGQRGTAMHDSQLTAALARARQQVQPRHVEVNGSGTPVTGSRLVIGLGAPKPGFIWQVRRINVGPVDYAAQAYNPTGIYIIGSKTFQAGGLGTDDSGVTVFSTTSLWPAEGTWSEDELTLQAGEHVRVTVTGLTTGYPQVNATLAAVETAAFGPELYAL